MKRIKVFLPFLILLVLDCASTPSPKAFSLVGAWVVSESGELGVFHFREDGFADLVTADRTIISGETQIDGATLALRYEIDTTKSPAWIDLIAGSDQEEEELGRLAGLIQIRSPDRIALKLNFEGLDRPVSVEDPDPDAVLLTRVPEDPSKVTQSVLHYHEGVALAARGDLADAEVAFTQAIENWSARAEIYLERGFNRHKRLQYRQALADLERAIQLDPDSPIAFFRIGAVYRVLERNHEAIEAYTAAIELAPDYASAFNNRAWTYLQNDEVENAIQDANTALSLDPKSAFYDTRGWAYFYHGDYPRSKEDALAALELEPYSFFTRALLYRLNAVEYGTETASQTLRSYLAQLPAEQRQRDDLLLLLYLAGEVSLDTVKQSPYWVDYSTALRPAKIRE